MTRVIDTEDGVAGGVVRRYLDHEPELVKRLEGAGLAVVVFAPENDGSYDERPGFFEGVQAALSAAVATHGRAVYVASVHARPFFRGTPKPLPVPDARPGVFVGYFAVGEGGAVFVQPTGELGAQPALFHDAIGAMMTAYR